MRQRGVWRILGGALVAGGLLAAQGVGRDVLRAGAVVSPPPSLPAAAPSATVPADAYWLNAREQVHRSVAELLAQHRDALRRGLATHELMRGDRSRKWVALTFDDGPHPAYTPKLLALLKQQGVKATFFVVGEMAQRYPDLVRAELADGHDVGNHTYHHVNLKKIPPDRVAVELKACGEVLEGISHRTPHLFRPPGGDYNSRVAEVAEALGYTTVLWTDDPGDYANPGAGTIEQRLLSRVGKGGIILIHDGIQQTMDTLPRIIETLKSRGYTFVTVDEMLAGSHGARGVMPATVTES